MFAEPHEKIPIFFNVAKRTHEERNFVMKKLKHNSMKTQHTYISTTNVFRYNSDWIV